MKNLPNYIESAKFYVVSRRLLILPFSLLSVLAAHKEQGLKGRRGAKDDGRRVSECLSGVWAKQ